MRDYEGDLWNPYLHPERSKHSRQIKQTGEQVAYLEEDQSMRALGIGLIRIRSGFERCLDAAVITRCHSLEQRVRYGIDRSS